MVTTMASRESLISSISLILLCFHHCDSADAATRFQEQSFSDFNCNNPIGTLTFTQDVGTCAGFSNGLYMKVHYCDSSGLSINYYSDSTCQNYAYAYTEQLAQYLTSYGCDMTQTSDTTNTCEALSSACTSALYAMTGYSIKSTKMTCSGKIKRALHSLYDSSIAYRSGTHSFVLRMS